MVQHFCANKSEIITITVFFSFKLLSLFGRRRRRQRTFCGLMATNKVMSRGLYNIGYVILRSFNVTTAVRIHYIVLE